MFGDSSLPEFVSFIRKSPFGRDYFFSTAHQTVNLASINITHLRAFPIPLPPIKEQHRIIDRIGDYFAKSAQIESDVSNALLALEKTEESILIQALRGN